MSYSWFWVCTDCCSVEGLFEKRTKDDRKAALLASGAAEEAQPQYALELLSDRPKDNKRCSDCEGWHLDEPNYHRGPCSSHRPFPRPVCQRCKSQMQPLFLEGKAIVVVEKAFTTERPIVLTDSDVYDAFLYAGKRYEGKGDGWPVVSAQYFYSRGGRKSGSYSPYFPREDFLRLSEAVQEWQSLRSSPNL